MHWRSLRLVNLENEKIDVYVSQDPASSGAGTSSKAASKKRSLGEVKQESAVGSVYLGTKTCLSRNQCDMDYV